LAVKRVNLTAIEAPSISRCLRVAQSQPLRLAIISREFPGDEGGEVIQEIVRHRPLLPIIIVNKSRSVDAAIFAKRIGAVSIFAPIDEDEVANICRRFLEATGVANSNKRGPDLPIHELGGYTIIRGLGPGGSRSTIFLADAPLRAGKPKVALKVLLGSNFSEEDRNDAICDFLAIAEQSNDIDVPGLVPILDHGYDPDQEAAWIAFDFVEGFSLGHHYATSRLPLPRKLETLAEICRLLAPLHKAGIIHGNLRPSSILIDTAGQLLLTNYGEGIQDTRDLTIESARYVPPEVVAGAPLSPQSDIFSLGAVGYRLICGVPPFDGATPPAILASVAIMHPPHPRHHVPSLPTCAGAVIKRMLKKAPAERFQCVNEARDALREAAYLCETAGEGPSTGSSGSSSAGASTWFNIPKDT
jgi:serine/threonine-protein kinase